MWESNWWLDANFSASLGLDIVILSNRLYRVTSGNASGEVGELIVSQGRVSRGEIVPDVILLEMCVQILEGRNYVTSSGLSMVPIMNMRCNVSCCVMP